MLLPMEMQPNVVKSAKNPESNQEELKLKKPDWCIQIISVCKTVTRNNQKSQNSFLLIGEFDFLELSTQCVLTHK